MTFSNIPTSSPPAYLEGILAKAMEHFKCGRLGDCESLLRQIIRASPQHLPSLYRLGIICFQTDRAGEAIEYLEQARLLQPHNRAILNSLGVASHLIGHDTDAIRHFKSSLAIEKDEGTLANLGKALLEQGKYEEALEYLVDLAQRNSAFPGLWVIVAKCHFEKGMFEEAVSALNRALDNNSEDIDALGGLSAALIALDHVADARAMLERALAIAPTNSGTLLNMGEFLAFNDGKTDEALDFFNKVLAIDPQHATARWRKSFALLARGDYRAGWKLYAECLGNRDTRGLNKFAAIPLWNGEYLLDKHLLIWCEQGLGDSLQFIRYAELCKERVGRISVYCDEPLVRLFKGLPYIDDAAHLCETGRFDAHVPILNLPHIFDTSLETVPPAPYLIVDTEIQSKWDYKFAKPSACLKVGLVWAGGSHEDKIIPKLTNLQRSISLEQILPWLALAGIEFYSLQRDKPAAQITELNLQSTIVDLMPDVSDFADTAAIVKNLDLIISVDTAVAHLAGGLGMPVWILSRYNADWRWLRNQPKNPWYSTARIYGQPQRGDWASVIETVRYDLERAAKERSNDGH